MWHWAFLGIFSGHGHAEINRIIDLNIRTATSLIHHFLPQMVKKDHGTILNVASVAGTVGGFLIMLYIQPARLTLSR